MGKGIHGGGEQVGSTVGSKGYHHSASHFGKRTGRGEGKGCECGWEGGWWWGGGAMGDKTKVPIASKGGVATVAQTPHHKHTGVRCCSGTWRIISVPNKLYLADSQGGKVPGSRHTQQANGK